MGKAEDFDIAKINSGLATYLNGRKDSKWEVLLPPFCSKYLSETKDNLDFAEIYEQAIAKLGDDTKIEQRVVCPVATFEEWEQTISTQDADSFLRPVFELCDFVRSRFAEEEILGFYLHGSISTQDYVPYYSDLDTLVVVRKTVMKDARKLRDFKRRLTRSNTFLHLLDPLQHHSHFVITEYDLQAYDQTIFPLCLFGFCTELSNFRTSLNFNVLPSQNVNLLKSFGFWMQYFEHPERFGFSMDSSYAVKQFVQSIIFILILYTEIRDSQFYYKKFIFDLVEQDFDCELWNLIERASAVRRTCQFHSVWPYKLRKLIGWIHPKLLHLLHKKLDRSIAEDILDVMGHSMLDEAQCLVETMSGKLNL
jgi:predicted nucleotidyltransferase